MADPVSVVAPGLLNYGVLGLWTLSLLYDKWATNKKFVEAIDNNTRAIRENTVTLAQIKAKMNC